MFFHRMNECLYERGLTASVTGKCGIWREKLPDAESAVGAESPKVWANARTCPVHAVLGRILGYASLVFELSVSLAKSLPNANG